MAFVRCTALGLVLVFVAPTQVRDTSASRCLCDGSVDQWLRNPDGCLAALSPRGNETVCSMGSIGGIGLSWSRGTVPEHFCAAWKFQGSCWFSSQINALMLHVVMCSAADSIWAPYDAVDCFELATRWRAAAMAEG